MIWVRKAAAENRQQEAYAKVKTQIFIECEVVSSGVYSWNR